MLSESDLHKQLSEKLYVLALSEAKERWPGASETLHRKIIHAALASAYLRARAGDHYAV